MKEEVKRKLELLRGYIDDKQKIEILTYIIKELLEEVEQLKNKL